MAVTTLKILREVKGCKQEDIAAVLGISQNTYSRLERAPKMLTVEQVEKLAKFYGVKVDDLISDVPPVVVFNTAVNSTGISSGVKKNTGKDYNDIKHLKNDIASLRIEINNLSRLLEHRKRILSK